MKKWAFLMVIGFLSSAVLTGCGASANCEDNPLHKIGDTFATLGKDGLEKDSVLAERKAGRMAKCVEAKAEKAAGELKDKLGL